MSSVSETVKQPAIRTREMQAADQGARPVHRSPGAARRGDLRVGRPQRDLGRGGTLYAVVIVQFAMKRRKLVNSVEGTQMAETLPTNDERRPS